MNSLSKDDTIKWLASVGVTNYTIRDDGIVDVNGLVRLVSMGLHAIPIQFGHVSGSFYCSYNKLTSLAGAPQSVGNTFLCENNPQLKILSIFKIKGITEIYHEGENILNKYYNPDGSGDIIAAQDELIDAGFGDIARLK